MSIVCRVTKRNVATTGSSYMLNCIIMCSIDNVQLCLHGTAAVWSVRINSSYMPEPDYGLFIAGPLIYKTVGEIHLAHHIGAKTELTRQRE